MNLIIDSIPVFLVIINSILFEKQHERRQTTNVENEEIAEIANNANITSDVDMNEKKSGN